MITVTQSELSRLKMRPSSYLCHHPNCRKGGSSFRKPCKFTGDKSCSKPEGNMLSNWTNTTVLLSVSRVWRSPLWLVTSSSLPIRPLFQGVRALHLWQECTVWLALSVWVTTDPANGYKDTVPWLGAGWWWELYSRNPERQFGSGSCFWLRLSLALWLPLPRYGLYFWLSTNCCASAATTLRWPCLKASGTGQCELGAVESGGAWEMGLAGVGDAGSRPGAAALCALEKP